jgi:hypothetical protein
MRAERWGRKYLVIRIVLAMAAIALIAGTGVVSMFTVAVFYRLCRSS